MQGSWQVEVIGWESAWKALKRVVPNANYYTPSGILSASSTWETVADEQSELTDWEQLARVATLLGCADVMILVTDWSFVETHGPCVVPVRELRAFASAYRDMTGELIFCGLDVVIVSERPEAVFVLDHENRGFLKRA